MNCSTLRTLTLASALLLSACSNKVDENTATEIPAPAAESTANGHLYIGHDTEPITVYGLMGFNKLDDIAVVQAPNNRGAHSLGLSEDGQLLAAAVKQANALSILDTATRQLVRNVALGSAPSLVRVWGMTAVVAHAPNQISVVDLPSGAIKRTFTMAVEPQNMAFASEGQRLVVTHEDHDAVFVYDLENGELIKQVDLSEYGVRPRGVEQSPNAKHIAVALEYSNKVLIMNDEYRVVGEVLTGEVPHEVAYNQDGSELVVTLMRGKALQVFDSETWMLEREMPVEDQCLRFAFTPVHTHLIVACGSTNKLLVLNYATGSLVREILDIHSPRALVVNSQ